MIVRAVAAVLILLCAGCGQAPSSSPLWSALEATLGRYASELPPGEGISLRLEAGSPNLVWAQARGDGVDPTQAVRIASITKTFVAAATRRLTCRCAPANRSGRDRNLQNAVPLVAEQLVSLLDVIEPEAVRDHGAQVHAA